MMVALSLAAACCYALASVLQQRAAAAAPTDRSLRLGLLTHLLRRRLWLAGILADLAGFVAQALALGRGPLIAVQLLLVSGLPLALVIAASFDHRRLSEGEWLAGAAVSAGLAVLLIVGRPSAGGTDAPARSWLLAGTAGATVVLVAIWLARRVTDARRAALLALAAGITFGFTAALTKAMVARLDVGVAGTLGSWQPYALAAVGLGGLLLAQSAFQAGPLAASLPTITVVDPTASTAFGITILAERVATGPLRVTVEIAAAVVIVVGIVALTRTPRTADRRG